jgi:potassium efflux system protein
VKAAPAPLKPLAEGVVELWRFRKSSEAPSTRMAQLKPEKDELEKLLKKLHEEEKTTKERIRVASRPQTLAPILDHQRSLLSLLPSVYHYEQSEIDHRRQLNEYLGEQLKYKQQLEDLTNTDEELVELLEEYFGEQPEREEQQEDLINADEELENLLDKHFAEQSKQEDFLTDAQELFNEKREALETLITEYENLQRELEELSNKEGEMVVFIKDYKEYLDQQSMWVPVAEVLQLQDFKKIEKGFAPLFEPANWQLLTETLVSEIWNSPVWSGVIVILVLAFFPVQTRLKRRLFQLSDEFSESFLAPFALTRNAFFITLLLPLWLPVICWIVGYRLLRVLPTTGDPAANPAFVPAFGKALAVMAFILCVLRLLRYLVKPNGLGEVHFRWPKQQLAKVRLHLHLYTVCVVPLVFLITMIYNAGTSEERRSLGRILMVALLLLTSWFLYRVLAPARSKDERTSNVKLSLRKKLLIYGPCCVPLCFALLSISGYTYTAAVLMGRLILSSGILLLLVMLNELAYRWVYIARGKLALEQARQRQEAREAEEAAKAEGAASDAPRMFDPKSSGVDLSAINTQTRKLLTTSFGLAVFISMWWVWSPVTPQVAFLNQPIYEIETSDSNVVDGATNVPPPVERDRLPTDYERWLASLTYGNLLLFLLTIVLTIIASKNLPGLLEISVLQKLPLDTGIRYAAGTIARYIVLAIGIIIGCQFLHIGSTQLSIIAGGLAIGLGFGLQEMFANFISGIILLFEQPLRVGDIVTVGDVTGTVTRIRIRATTITDWDRKEFIIPNKELVVGRFNNWTLTDTINRVVILVGVAYGSDTERAKELLLKVCAEHPEVLDDPAPSAVFDLFGGSSLNITLRCYLPRLDNRLLTIHELHTAIDREFKKAGIEIAFPQMDLHLRSVDEIKNPIPLAQEVPETEQV